MITQLSLSDEDQARARELYEKAKDGTLSKEEDAELVEIGDASLIIDRLRIRAAGSLKRAGLSFP